MAEIESISLDQEAQEMWENNEETIQEIYGGRSALFKDKLREVDERETIDEKIQELNTRIAANLRENIRLSRKKSRLEEERRRNQLEEELERKEEQKKQLIDSLRELNKKTEKDFLEEAKDNYPKNKYSNHKEVRENWAQRQFRKHREKIRKKGSEVGRLRHKISELKAELGDYEEV